MTKKTKKILIITIIIAYVAICVVIGFIELSKKDTSILQQLHFVKP